MSEIDKNQLSRARSSASFAFADPRRDSQFSLAEIVQPSDLSVVFQPIVDFTTGALFAHEALVRCSIEAYKNPLALFARAVAAGATVAMPPAVPISMLEVASSTKP